MQNKKAKSKTSSRTVAKTTKTAAKPLPKVSPARGMAVADWVKAKAAGWQAQVVTRLLATASRAVPHANQDIKWNQPIVEHGGPIAFIKLASKHVTFGFWRGAQLDDPHRKLEGGTTMKHVKVAAPDDIDEKLLAGWLAQAAALNAQHGGPTRRG